MDQEKCWQQFTSSGKVEDYLAYRAVSGRDILTQETGRGREEHERKHNNDWNDYTVVTDKGI